MIVLEGSGHLFTTNSLLELYEFATRRLALKPEWNHYTPLFPHWDLTTPYMRGSAELLGAYVPSDRAEVVSLIGAAKDYCRTLTGVIEPTLVSGLGAFRQPVLKIDYNRLLPILRAM